MGATAERRARIGRHRRAVPRRRPALTHVPRPAAVPLFAQPQPQGKAVAWRTWKSTLPALIAALLATSPAALAAAAPQTAQAFAERLVQRMNTDSWVKAKGARDIDPAFQKLMDENDRLAQGVDLLDADPVCQCQDSGGHYRLLSVTPNGATTNARISVDRGAPYTLVLRQSGARWLISDVIDSGGSLRAQLIRHNSCMRAHHTDAAIARCFGDH